MSGRVRTDCFTSLPPRKTAPCWSWNRDNQRVSGYVTDTTYADTFFRELSPTWLNYVAALNGARTTPLDSRFRYLELGCGFGTSAVVNAASFPHASFDACDFNESHVEGGIAYAAQLALTNIT